MGKFTGFCEVMKEIGKDEYGVVYFACDYSLGVLDELPWGDEEFECVFFPSAPVDEASYRMAIEAVLKKNIDWVYTCGPESKRWHDIVDEIAVALGLQEEVGNGHPMTTWFEEIDNFEDWDRCNFGGSDYFLFVFISPKEPLDYRLERLRIRLEVV